ncbi:MAG: glutamine synthetase III [Bacteroidota bacterium]|nr:glutamine synthetase III [Bacteroidota bacterium]
MASFRERALAVASSRSTGRYYVEEGPVSTYFGQNVFTVEKMRKYLPADALQAVLNARATGEKIPRTVSDRIASGMKAWAVERGATHYTHLFQPLTGATAEKHEAFITPGPDGAAMEQFRGSALVQQEPDASSFPNGGLRNTFEARGYTAWDPASPVFVLDATLCIPSVFVSYNGDALDMKVPNLRSIQALDKAATRVARLFDPGVESVKVNVGLEQEYFLVDAALFDARPDLQLCGRTVIGHTSAKDQQLEDHYFGAIPSRVENYMKDFETEAYKLGIPLETRHNEVAPNQFECAPLFSEITSAIDQNMLLMIVMQKVAEKHNLKVIFHEKPFQGVNGSGKHCNWSLCTDKGKNLLSPGKTHEGKLRFLSFYSSVLKAVADHGYLLMASVCSLGNTWRLGGNEAPPAILSVFSGSTLSKVFDAILGLKAVDWESAKDSICIVGTIPDIIPDNTDRNRTSPFAFTGNRFEFRALGSSANPASATFVLNTIVADSLRQFADKVDERTADGEDKEKAILTTVRDFLKEAGKVMFEGNGYSKEWQEESARRGLRPVSNAVEAFHAFQENDSVQILTETGVLSRTEIDARVEVLEETFVKKLQIEARVIGDICLNHVIPAATAYQNVLALNLRSGREVFGGETDDLCRASAQTYRKIAGLINSLSDGVAALVEERRKANRVPDINEKARLYSTAVMAAMQRVREDADNLEMLVDDSLWPLPKYRELLYL